MKELSLVTTPHFALPSVMGFGDGPGSAVLIRHDQIDVNLTNRWLEDPLIWQPKVGIFQLLMNRYVIADRKVAV